MALELKPGITLYFSRHGETEANVQKQFQGDHVNTPLTQISIAYLQNQTEFVAAQVCPIIPVTKQSDRYYVYNRGDFFRDQTIVDVLGAGVDVNRMRAVPKRDPLRDHARHSVMSGPFAPNTGSVAGSGTFWMVTSALACSFLLPWQRLYLPVGG